MPLEQEREEEIEQQQAPVEGQTVVNIEPDDDGDDDGTPDLSTLDKRGKRSWVREIKQNYESERTKREALEREVSELRGRVSAQPTYQPPVQQQQADPTEQHVAMLEQHMDAALAALTNAPQGTPQAQLDQWRNNYRQLERQRLVVLAQAQAPQPQQRQPDHSVVVMQAEYPELYSDASLYHEANAEFARLMRANGGKHGGLPMMRKAADNVFARNGIRQKSPPPNQSVQAKLTGTPSRAGASGGGGNTVTLTPGQRKMAIQYWNGTDYADKTDDEKIRRWTKEVWLKPE